MSNYEIDGHLPPDEEARLLAFCQRYVRDHTNTRRERTVSIPQYRAWLRAEQKMYLVSTLYPQERTKQVELEGISCVYAFTIGEEVDLMLRIPLLTNSGSPVYEGDIVQGEYQGDETLPRVVAYNEQGLLVPFHENTGYKQHTWLSVCRSGFEVIGNIYEHPEMIPSTPHAFSSSREKKT